MTRVSAFKTALIANTIRREPPDPSQANMTAFLKIDDCNTCRRSLPWEWVPAVPLKGKPLPGTGVWRSQLVDRQCPACLATLERERENQQRAVARRVALTHLLGGEKPYREFTFEGYEVTPGNRIAYEKATNFNAATANLYLWGGCGVGKTHLAYAAARHCFEQTLSVVILRPGQLSRKVRMKDPDQQQATVDELVHVDVLVCDDLGHETTYSCQILQELLDVRDFSDRTGLIVTCKYSLDALATKLADDTIPSRLAGMCQVVEIKGPDRRLKTHGAPSGAGLC